MVVFFFSSAGMRKYLKPIIIKIDLYIGFEIPNQNSVQVLSGNLKPAKWPWWEYVHTKGQIISETIFEVEYERICFCISAVAL